MKKFLVILMVVAMASFLFVGCLPSVTPEAEEEAVEEEEEEVVAPVSATPVLTAVLRSDATTSIVSLTSSSTQYMNIADVGSSILVTGTAPSESLIQIYLDDVAIAPALAEASTSGLWSVAIAKSSLGDDGEKVLTAKVTEVGLDESEASNAATFTLDTVRPSATTLVATAAALATSTTDSAVATIAAAAAGDTLPILANITTIDVVPGVWTIYIQGDSTATVNNVVVTTPAGASTSYIYSTGAMGFITGFNTTLNSNFVAGDAWYITVTEAGTDIISRARVLFSEEITNTTATTRANYVFSPVTATIGSYANLYTYFTTLATTAVQGSTLTLIVDDVEDLAGNIQTTASSISTTVAAASATSLAP